MLYSFYNSYSIIIESKNMEVFSMKKRVPANRIDRETRERIIKKQAAIVNLFSTDEDLKLVGPKTQKEIGKSLYMSQSTVSSRQKTYDNMVIEKRCERLEAENRELKRRLGLDHNDDDIIDMPEDDFKWLPDNNRHNRKKKY